MLLAFGMHAKTDYAAEFLVTVEGQDDTFSKTHSKGQSLELLASWSIGAAKSVSREPQSADEEHLASLVETFSALLARIASKLPSFEDLDTKGEDVDWRKRRAHWFDIIRKVIGPSYYGPSIAYFGDRGARDGKSSSYVPQAKTFCTRQNHFVRKFTFVL